MDAPDLRKLRDAFRLKPVEEFRRRAGMARRVCGFLICAVKNSRKR